jgi:hypothetical protein
LPWLESAVLPKFRTFFAAPSFDAERAVTRRAVIDSADRLVVRGRLTALPVPLPKGPDGRQLTQSDFAKIVAEAKSHRLGWNPITNIKQLLWFARQSQRDSRWDFRNMPVNSGMKPGGHAAPGETDATVMPGQDFGNFLYAVNGLSMGIPRWLLLKAAGLVAIHDGESRLNMSFLRANFDIPRDQAIIKRALGISTRTNRPWQRNSGRRRRPFVRRRVVYWSSLVYVSLPLVALKLPLALVL